MPPPLSLGFDLIAPDNINGDDMKAPSDNMKAHSDDMKAMGYNLPKTWCQNAG